MKKPKSEWSKVVTETEVVFDFLVVQGLNNDCDVDLILEIPTSTGETCFDLASRCSFAICDFIIATGIKVNSINTDMMVPEFVYPSLSVQMMEKGINPHVINYGEKCREYRSKLFS